MKMINNNIVGAIIIVIVILEMGMLVVVGEGRAPVLHEVGGDRFGWRLNVNFSDWAANQIFFVGDWLYFGFDKHKLSVLEVNRTGYENCTESNYMTNITKGGRDVFNLTAARPYYFISGRGYCIHGVKLSIIVQNPPNNDPLPPPSDDALYKTKTKTNISTTIITSHANSIPYSFQPFSIIIIILSIGIIIIYC